MHAPGHGNQQREGLVCSAFRNNPRCVGNRYTAGARGSHVDIIVANSKLGYHLEFWGRIHDLAVNGVADMGVEAIDVGDCRDKLVVRR